MKQKIQMLQTRLSKALLYKYLFYKYYYKFLFLHKPLCDRYKNSTLKLFGLYVCRSCLFLYTGLIIGIFVVLTKVQSVVIDKYFWLGFSGAFLTLVVSHPYIYGKFSRVSRDFIRFYDGLFLGAVVCVSFKISINTGIAALVLFWLIKRIYNRKRSGEKICAGCSELKEGTTCSGYKEQKQAFLDLDEEYSNIIMTRKRKDFEL